ncbi:MAG: hypothetical protein P4M11_10200 [Candidatus Pacebacteria bacterium]|nr:hypothetical protein [Candidatus Paceibacterota bacterium]
MKRASEEKAQARTKQEAMQRLVEQRRRKAEGIKRAIESAKKSQLEKEKLKQRSVQKSYFKEKLEKAMTQMIRREKSISRVEGYREKIDRERAEAQQNEEIVPPLCTTSVCLIDTTACRTGTGDIVEDEGLICGDTGIVHGAGVDRNIVDAEHVAAGRRREEGRTVAVVLASAHGAVSAPMLYICCVHHFLSTSHNANE